VKDTRYFVVVFGNPYPDKDKVENERYEAGDHYPPFNVARGDLLLLYCTEEYAEYSKSIPGTGRVTEPSETVLEYEWRPLSQPIPRERLRQTFTTEDWEKMFQLGITTRRVFEISKESFSRTINT
jgi:hypothetical protein